MNFLSRNSLKPAKNYRTSKKINSMATEMSLKLIIDPKSRRVLFAEADRDVVDFIISLLCMPMASIVKLLTTEHMVGSIGSIYKSVESMEATHIQSSLAKSLILGPTFTSPSKFLTGSTSTNVKYYKCYYNSFCSSSRYITDTPNTPCPSCNHKNHMTTEVTCVGPNRERVSAESTINASGFVRGLVPFTITDDLTMMPGSSSTTTIALLKNLNIKDASLLEERTVKLGPKEGLELLKSSLRSKTVLTDVFLGIKAEPE